MSKSKSTIVGQRVIEGDFKGNATIGIWNIDANGNTVGAAPIIAFGYNKARAIVDNIQGIMDWVSAQERPAPVKRFNVDDLTEADILAMQARLAALTTKK